MTSKSPPVTVLATTSASPSSVVSIMVSKTSSSTASVTTSESSSDGKATLHHVLSEVLSQPWWLFSEALERSGFDEIQDVLLMNQAKRDTLTFLNANGVVTPVLQDKLLNVKLFGSYCNRIGRPIVNWTKVTKANFNSVTLYTEEEKVTIPHYFR